MLENVKVSRRYRKECRVNAARVEPNLSLLPNAYTTDQLLSGS